MVEDEEESRWTSSLAHLPLSQISSTFHIYLLFTMYNPNMQ